MIRHKSTVEFIVCMPVKLPYGLLYVEVVVLDTRDLWLKCVTTSDNKPPHMGFQDGTSLTIIETILCKST